MNALMSISLRKLIALVQCVRGNYLTFIFNTIEQDSRKMV